MLLHFLFLNLDFPIFLILLALNCLLQLAFVLPPFVLFLAVFVELEQFLAFEQLLEYFYNQASSQSIPKSPLQLLVKIQLQNLKFKLTFKFLQFFQVGYILFFSIFAVCKHYILVFAVSYF